MRSPHRSRDRPAPATDTSKLIHKVITGPLSPREITPMQEDILPKYGLGTTVERSKILDPP